MLTSFRRRPSGRAAGAALLLALLTFAGQAEARSQIRIVGSSTVYPFTTAVVEQFMRANPRFSSPIVESTGTGGGFKLFCSGVGARTADIANASRRIKASEAKQCEENGVHKIIELQIGLDGLSVAQDRAARPIELTTRDLYVALAASPFGEAQTARTWKDVRADLPDTRIEVLGPPPTSGTRDAFNELVMEKGCLTNPAMKALKARDEDRYKTVCTRIREDGAYVETGENDNLVVQKLASNPRALGIFGYSFLEENRDRIRDVPLNGVPATYETISSGRYPAARPLYIYVKGEHMGAIRGLREFLTQFARDSTWGPKGYLSRRGLIPAPDAVRKENERIAAELHPLDLASLE